jgi:hydroxymethylbilane synthase
VPVAALARVNGGELRCEALVASVDAEEIVRGAIIGSPAEAIALGKQLAQSLWRKGADKILAEVKI